MPSDNHTTNITNKTEAEAVAAIQKRAAEVQTIELGTVGGKALEALAVPQGVSVQSMKGFLQEYADAPERRAGLAVLEDLTSFIDHANRFKDEDSAIFASRKGPTDVSLTSVFDYHRKGPTGAPRFGRHRGVYQFPISDEWKAWAQNSGKPMDQAAFAEFIEARITDVCTDTTGPSAARLGELLGGPVFATPSKLLDLSKGLSVRVDMKMSNAQNLSSGETAMVFTSEHKDDGGAALKVPSAFVLAIPVFRNGELYQIPVRLRYRLRDGKVSWLFELYQPEKYFDDAFQGACAAAQKATELPLFQRSPE